MTVSGISGASIQFPSSTQMNQMKQNFDDLGTALKSGNLGDAKTALATLQQNAPAQANDSNNPMATDMKTLSNAIDSGDLKTAQDTYSKIQSNQAKAPSGGGTPPSKGDTVSISSQASASGGKAASGGQAKSSASASTSSSSSSSLTKTYDKMDANKDGKVSVEEELDYKAKHPDQNAAASTTSTNSTTQANSENSSSENSTSENKVETYA